MILILESAFSSAHLYHQPAWSAEENAKVFGRCFTEHGHGHNYRLQVGFKTTEQTLERDRKRYQELLNQLTKVLDHEHLNFVIPEFKTTIPTTENIADYFLQKLKNTSAKDYVSFIKLFEMNDLWTEIRL